MPKEEIIREWKQNGILYLIASFSQGENQIYEALKIGVDFIQLREKDISSREFLKRACLLREWTRKYTTLFLINDRLDIALLSEADGIHLGQQDIPVREARRILGKNRIIGVTAKTVEQAIAAEREGADYLGSGAWFLSNTKKDAVPISKEQYIAIIQKSSIPNVAVGGINKRNYMLPIACGASGIAVSEGILGEQNIKETIRQFRKGLI